MKGSEKEKIFYVFVGCDIEKKEYIFKENFRNMFKVYFEISFEFVRDVVRLCEEEMMVFFDDLGDKLVFVIFNVFIFSDVGLFIVNGKLVMLMNNLGSSISVKGVDGRLLIMEVML